MTLWIGGYPEKILAWYSSTPTSQAINFKRVIMNIISRSEAARKGLTYYFTGKPCKRGHVSERWTSAASCTTCQAKRRLENPDKGAASRLKYYLANKEKISKYHASNYQKNKEKIDAANSLYRKKNPEKSRSYVAKWAKKNTLNRFIRDSLKRVITNWKGGRERYEDLLGYTEAELKKHIERQFEKGMSWDNRGEWHIDHIVSISTHIKNGEKDPAVINCPSNLRPTWAVDNLSKGNSVVTLC